MSIKQFIINEHLTIDDSSKRAFLRWALLEFDPLKGRYSPTIFEDTKEALFLAIEERFGVSLEEIKLESLAAQIDPEILSNIETKKPQKAKKTDV